MAKNQSNQTQQAEPPKRSKAFLYKILKYLLGIGVAFAAVGAVCLVVIMAVIYPKLPDIKELLDYKPILPMRVYSSEGILIEEFGIERRRFVVLEQVPKDLIHAILSAEDNRFYEHGGIDYKGIARAALSNLTHGLNQGASTITMQVARNVFLSSERTFARKLYETGLTFKLEHNLTKDQILEIYINHIYLGHRSYGFAAAAETYFGKKIENITTAEAAMLAGLPKFPSTGNPFKNFVRSKQRQEYILGRMAELGYITKEQADEAKHEEIKLNKKERRRLDKKNENLEKVRNQVHADFVAEMVRATIEKQFGDATYTKGFKVFTTIVAEKQNAAYSALRRGISDYEQRQKYRGPEGFINIDDSLNEQEQEELIIKSLKKYPDNGDFFSAVVLEASPKEVKVQRSINEIFTITGKGLYPVTSGLRADADSKIKIVRGSVVRIVQDANNNWALTQMPEVEGALIAVSPNTGAIISLVGGFDFNHNKFNHVTQAWRQTGSALKPFVYSASLEKGVSPVTIINDAPVSFGSWRPKNYGSSFDGPVSARRAMARSMNIPMVRVINEIKPSYAQEWLLRFGFSKEKNPPYLTLALGAGEATPLQMATAYSVFANGGYMIHPYLIARIEDSNGKLIKEFKSKALTEADRVIPARNAFIMNSMLQEVTISGTAARTRGMLRRTDIAGKTGTTNNSRDAWFAGYQPNLTAIAWIGYDSPKQLGARETGNSVAMPVWINYMQKALANIPVARPGKVPNGLTNSAGEWLYTEYLGAKGITSIGIEKGFYDNNEDKISEIERNSILDLFR